MEGILPSNRFARTALWSLLFVALLIAFFCFFYEDLQTIYDNTMVFWEGIIQGRSPLEFYEYSVEMTRSPWAVNYNFFPYILTSIWCLPILAYCKIRGVDYIGSIIGRMWFKLLFFLALLLAAYLLMRILKLLGKSKRVQHSAAFVFLSSIVVVSFVLIIPNIEILALCFMLAGIVFLLQGNKPGFLIMFAMATACKSFALFLALPIILLFEKNVFKAVAQLASTTAIILFEKLLFINSSAARYALGANLNFALEKLCEGSFIGVSPFLVCLVAISIVCYMHRTPSFISEDSAAHQLAIEPNDAWFMLYVPVFVFGTFSVCIDMQEYWGVLVAPFLVILIFRENRLAPLLVLIETIGSTAYVLHCAFNKWAFSGDTANISRGVLSRLCSIPSASSARYPKLINFFDSSPLSTFKASYSSIFVACMIAMLVILSPKIFEFCKHRVKIHQSVSLVSPPMRILLCYGLIGMILCAKLSTIPDSIYSNISDEGVPAEQSLVTGDQGHTYCQVLDVKGRSSLDTLILVFKNPDDKRINFARVKVEVWDESQDLCVWSETRGGDEIEDGAPQQYDLRNTSLDEGHAYELRVEGIPGTRHNAKVRLYPYVCGSTEYEGLDIDGNPQNGVLQYELR